MDGPSELITCRKCRSSPAFRELNSHTATPSAVVRPEGKRAAFRGKRVGPGREVSFPGSRLLHPSGPETGPAFASARPAIPLTGPEIPRTGPAVSASGPRGKVFRPEGKSIQISGNLVRPRGRAFRTHGNPSRPRSPGNGIDSASQTQARRALARDSVVIPSYPGMRKLCYVPEDLDVRALK